MTDEFVLDAKVREVVGKGSSRRLRRLEESIPAIVYGGKNKAPLNITLAHKDLAKATDNEAFFSHIVTLNIGGKSEQVILKDLQRHPARARLLHADFMRVSKDVAINVNVPLHFVNEDTCKGVKDQGGAISHSITEVEISCLPGDLPEFIEVDVAALEMDQILHLSDLKLPKGVEFLHPVEDEDHNHPVVAVHEPKKVIEEEPIEAAEAEEAAPDDAAEDADDAEKE